MRLIAARRGPPAPPAPAGPLGAGLTIPCSDRAPGAARGAVLRPAGRRGVPANPLLPAARGALRRRALFVAFHRTPTGGVN